MERVRIGNRGRDLYLNICHFRLIIRTPVALKIALAMAALGGTVLISPAPLAP